MPTRSNRLAAKAMKVIANLVRMLFRISVEHPLRQIKLHLSLLPLPNNYICRDE